MRELIETEDLLTAAGARLAIDPVGNGLAVWLEYDRDSYPDGSAIWSNRCRVSGGWSAAERIENPYHSSEALRGARSCAGNAVVEAHHTAIRSSSHSLKNPTTEFELRVVGVTPMCSRNVFASMVCS